MSPLPLVESDDNAIPLTLITDVKLDDWRNAQADAVKAWLSATGFSGKAGEICLMPRDDG
ncbi:MAG: leucyl aminopeptidase family protein, partial [Rhodospirillaceae bacterium]|nr:leucyl aminopeptidase family protein [Rhodospirillaceae bacterium]